MEPTSFGAHKMSQVQTGKELIDVEENLRLRALYKEKVGISAPTLATVAELEAAIADPESEITRRRLEELEEAQSAKRRDLH